MSIVSRRYNFRNGEREVLFLALLLVTILFLWACWERLLSLQMQVHLEDKAKLLSRAELESAVSSKWHSAATRLDLVRMRIAQYDSNMRSLYVDQEIKAELEEINSLYKNAFSDNRHKLFMYALIFNVNYFENKKILQLKKENVQLLKRQVASCQIGE